MAIASITYSASLQKRSWKRITPKKMLKHIDHKTHMVYVCKNPFYLATGELDMGIWCNGKDFKMRYPEKWQEIQAELALQKLKNV